MFRTIRRSWELLTARQKTGLFILSVLRVAVNLLDVAGVILIGFSVTVLLGNGASIPAAEWFPPGVRNSPAFLLLIVALIFFIKTVLGMLVARKTALYLARVEAHHSHRLANAFFSNGLERTRQVSRPDIEWTLLRSTEIAFQRVLNAGMSLQAEATLAVLVFGLMLFADWQASLVITAYFVAVLGIFQWLSNSKFRSAGETLSANSVLVTRVITDLVNTFREISVMQRTEFFLRSFVTARRNVADASASYMFLQSIPRLLIETALITGALLFVGWEYLRNSGAGDWSTLAILLVGSLRIMGALLPLQRSIAELGYIRPQASAAQSLLEDLTLKFPESKTVAPNATNQLSVEGSREGVGLHFSDVCFSYEAAGRSGGGTGSLSAAVIDKVTMSIPSGSYVALVGPSGAGKSTLVDLMLGLLQPSSGKICVDGEPPREFFASRPGAVGYVPQKPGIISGTIAENVALGVDPSDVDEQAVWDALCGAELHTFVTGLAGGIHSDLGPQQEALSGGQKQRMGLARALYGKPELLVLDEATSALDAETEASVTKSIMKLRGQTTIVVVAHRLTTVQNVDIAFVLERGAVLASGTFSELRRDVPLVQKYLKLMSVDE